MFVDIIPTKKLPRQLSILSYLAPKELERKVKIGQIVSIPLRNSMTTGVVVETKARSKIPGVLKYINGIVNENPVFTERQLELFQKLAQYYFVSATLFVHFALPRVKQSRKQEIKKARKQEIKKSKAELFWWREMEERNKYYLELARRAEKEKKQILILVPRVYQIDKMIEALGLEPKKVIKIHGGLKVSEETKAWQTAMSSKGIFIGTRSAIFYPYTNLDNIIVDEEESIDHKNYDMNPRYDVRMVAEMTGCKVILASSSPSVESYQNSRNQVDSDPKEESTKKARKQIVIKDLKNEITKQNYSFISEELEERIKETIKAEKQVFLLLNKKGESSHTVCKDCNYVFSCPECKLPLIREVGNTFHCYYCGYTEDLPPFCPKCSGPNFKSSGLGVQKVYNSLGKILENYKISILHKLPKSRNQKIKKPKNQENNNIIVGTEFALDKINWDRIGLVGIINADQLWQHAEFGTTEKAYSLLQKLLTLAPEDARFIVQTFNLDHYIIQSIVKGEPEIFYGKELGFRQSFGYPPFRSLLKLSVLQKSEKKAGAEARKIYNRLKLKADKEIDISEPIPILRKKIRGKYKFNIILKLKKLDDFGSLVKIVPNDWLIDVGPKTLLD